ncbi:MAG: CoA pyrophosphatase [Neisseria sp.]|nr:CoA pyrophosphatase [Neisseria sp.]
MNTGSIDQFLQQLSVQNCGFPNLRNARLANRYSEWREAAVLFGIMPQAGQWQILLTLRTATLRNHAGQIALPGGKLETGETHTAAALRETFEETGIAASEWQTFPSMSSLLLPSGYRITPVPAICREETVPEINPAEVAEVFYLPLSVAADLRSYHLKTTSDMPAGLPALYWQKREIWGATAAILYQTALLAQTHPLPGCQANEPFPNKKAVCSTWSADG